MKKRKTPNCPQPTVPDNQGGHLKQKGTMRNRIMLIGALGIGGAIFAINQSERQEDKAQTESATEAPNLRQRKVPYDGPGKELFSSPKYERHYSEYERWANYMPIPKMQISEGLNPPVSQMEDMFFEEGLNRTKLKDYYAYFHEIVTITENKMKSSQTLAERRDVANKFIGSLMNGYAGAFQDGKLGTKRKDSDTRDVNLNAYIPKINRVLIPHGFFITHDSSNNDGFSFELHTVEKIQTLTSSIGTETVEVPAITIKRKMDITAIEPSNTKKPGVVSYAERAFYQPHGRYVVFRADSSSKATEKHEAAHVGFHQILDGYKKGKEKIGRHGVIHMGHYQLVEDDYRGHTMHELDELIGLGTELMNLDDNKLADRMNSILNSTKAKHGPAYDFAAFIIFYEMSYSCSPEDYQAFVTQFRSTGTNIKEHLKSMPIELLRPIGERMVRLGMKLTGK